VWAWLKKYRTGIFRYHDGTRRRCADPIAVYRGLLAHKTFDIGTHPKLIQVDDPKISLEAIGVCARAVRDVFGIGGLTDIGDGLTDLECCALLAEFVQYAAGLKKNINQPPTSPPPTESPPSDPSTTKPASDCGSTSTAPCSAMPDQ